MCYIMARESFENDQVIVRVQVSEGTPYFTGGIEREFFEKDQVIILVFPDID